MLKSETAMLLAEISAIDRRELNQLTVESWHEMIGDLDFMQARAAVRRHYRRSSERIMPADLVRMTRPNPNAWMTRSEMPAWQLSPEERQERYGRAWSDETIAQAKARGIAEDEL